MDWDEVPRATHVFKMDVMHFFFQEEDNIQSLRQRWPFE